MGNRGEKRKRKERYFKDRIKKLAKDNAQLQTVISAENSLSINPAQRKKWYQHAFTKGATLTVFVFENFWGAAMLDNMDPKLAYLIFILVNSAILSFWIWVLFEWIWKNHKYAYVVKIASIFIAIFLLLITSPNFINHVIRPQGSIQIPAYTPDSTEVTVHYGNRDNDYFYTKTTIGELKNNPSTVFSVRVGDENQTVFYVHIKDDAVCVDTFLFTGLGNLRENASRIQSKYILSKPVVIKDNFPDRLPDRWRIYKNGTNFEIDNQYGFPVLLLEYKNAEAVIISGMFNTPMGICKVDNNESNIYLIGNMLSELGIYKVDNPFFIDKPFFTLIYDLFHSTRTFDLSKY